MPRFLSLAWSLGITTFSNRRPRAKSYNLITTRILCALCPTLCGAFFSESHPIGVIHCLAVFLVGC